MNPTPKDSAIRLVLYALLAMVTAAAAGVMAVDFSDPKQVTIFCLAILANGLNSVRSYIDQTPTQVKS